MPIAQHTPTSPLPAPLLRGTWLATLTLMVSACATVPVTNREFVNLAPDELMHAVGEQAYQEKKRQVQASSNQRDTDIVNQVATRVIQASEVDFPWEVTLFEEPGTVNAFCLPGGKIGVYTGILPLAQNEAGLAAIIGHEVGHAVARHGAERFTQEFALKIALSVTAFSLRNAQYRDIILRLLGIATDMGVRAYNREQESEADRIGLEYMARAGYDPREAAALWRRMAGQQGMAQGSLALALTTLLSTHPNPLERAQQIEEWLPLVLPHYEQSQQQPTSSLLPEPQRLTMQPELDHPTEQKLQDKPKKRNKPTRKARKRYPKTKKKVPARNVRSKPLSTSLAPTLQ